MLSDLGLHAGDQLDHGVDGVEVLGQQVIGGDVHVELVVQLGDDGHDVEGGQQAPVYQLSLGLEVDVGTNVLQNLENGIPRVSLLLQRAGPFWAQQTRKYAIETILAIHPCRFYPFTVSARAVEEAFGQRCRTVKSH